WEQLFRPGKSEARTGLAKRKAGCHHLCLRGQQRRSASAANGHLRPPLEWASIRTGRDMTISSAVIPRTTPDRLALLATLFCGLAAIFVMVVVSYQAGFVSPDSWTYLMMAESVRSIESCSISGEYVAYHP